MEVPLFAALLGYNLYGSGPSARPYVAMGQSRRCSFVNLSILPTEVHALVLDAFDIGVLFQSATDIANAE